MKKETKEYLLNEKKLKAITLARQTALNKIAKIFHPLYKFSYESWTENSGMEQKYLTIMEHIDSMNRKIKVAKEKYKQKIKELEQ